MPNSINQEAIDYTNPKAVAQAAEAALADLIADVDMTEEAEGQYRFDAQFVPNKDGGSAGRFLPVLVTIREDGTEHRDVSFAYSKDKRSAAIACCAALWPHVVLPEGERIRKALEAELDRFLGKVSARVAREKQKTRALVISERDGVDFNEALKMVEEADAAAIAEEEKVSTDAAAAAAKSKPDPAAEKCEDIFAD